MTFQSAIKINQFQFRSFVASFLAKIPRPQPHFLAKHWLTFITLQSAININQFQFRSFVAHLWPKYQGYSLTFWPKLAHFHHFSICNQNQSISISVIFRSFLAKIPRLQPYFLAKIGSFSSLFNLQSKSINFNFGHFSLILAKIPRLQPYFLAKIGSFSSLFNLQSKSINFNFGHFSLIFGQNTKAIALLFGHKLAHFHHFSICNQNQSISISVIFRSFLAKIPRLQPYFLARIGSFSSLFNLQSKSINFNFGHFSLIFGQNTKAIALLFGQNWLIFITFQSAIKINQFQIRSFFAHFWPKYQGYSLTFRPKLPHFHHFSICNQTQSISISVICRLFVAKIPRLQPYLLAKLGSLSSLYSLQSKSINFNFGHFSLML